MKGWIKLHRKIVDSKVFDNEKVLKFFIWCLTKAAHNEREIMVGYQKVKLRKGEFLFGRHSAAEALKMGPSTVRNCLATLNKLGKLDIKTTNKFSIVRVKRWSAYQNGGQQTTSKKPTNNQQSATNKNVKNYKNYRSSNKKSKVDKPVDGTIVELNDGTQAVRRFGVWMDADNPNVKINLSYYPELK